MTPLDLAYSRAEETERNLKLAAGFLREAAKRAEQAAQEFDALAWDRSDDPDESADLRDTSDVLTDAALAARTCADAVAHHVQQIGERV